MKLTSENYYSVEANKAYWSVSQFKSFSDCQAKAMAEINGSYIRPETESLLLGSYVDAYFSGEMEQFEIDHPEVFNKRTGELKAVYKKAEDAIYRAEQDSKFVDYMTGDNQVIMTGKLFGLDWKIKTDVLTDRRIVDLKFIKDMKPIYKDGELMTFIKAWGYDVQGFVYQQIVKANTGKNLPFYLAVITKETPADIELIHIPDFYLNSAGELVKHYVKEYDKVKRGLIEPLRCGNCEYCRATKVIEEPIEYNDLLGME